MAENQEVVVDQDHIKIESVYDIPVLVSVILGTSEMTVGQLVKLSKGSVVELDRKVGDPVDILVNDRLVAKGEVVIVDDKIGVTLTEIIRAEKDN
ncbi:MAG: flagellar motor switch protein FliN [Alphaproteobacteria bacterium 33-17]|nr:MAG: flagellar motor switch protein FliN [Alphaproteobacteria bacterium 33-17]